MRKATNRIVDLCVADGGREEEPFTAVLRRQCDARKLSCVICNDANVRQVLRDTESGRLRIRMCLDMFGHPENTSTPYTRLTYAAKDAGAFVINDPENAARAENKATVHYEFLRADIPVPFTIITRNWQPSRFRLSASEKRRLGSPFFVKPARGYGKQGVVRIERGSVKEIARARRFDPGDDFLIQKSITPVWIGHRMGWFRALYLAGQVVLCWWDTGTQHYEPVTIRQYSDLGLGGLADLALRIAGVLGMDFFSTEIAMVKASRGHRFVSVDYANHPIDLTMQTFSHSGVPDEIVEHVADRIADLALDVSRNETPAAGADVWFAG